MSSFPKGPKELSKAGYIYLGDSYCKAEGCGALLHWYKYSVTGQRIPVDSITRTPHYLSCAARTKKKPPKTHPVQLQRNMFEREPGED